MNLSHFKDKVIIITGAASGLGRAMSTLLAKQNAKLLLLDNNQEALDLVAAELKCASKVIDVTCFSAMKDAVLETLKRYGRLDYFFNNASIALLGEARDIPIEEWNRIIDVDLKGIVNGVIASYPVMIQQKSGHIVNVSSITGITPAVMLVPYAASKYGVVGLSHSLRMEAKQLGVKVSVACPNFVNTPIWTKSKVVGSKIKRPRDFLKLFQFSPRLLEPEEAADIILKGVLKNKPTILNDFHSRLLWWSYRLCPALWNWINDVYVMKKYRTLRK